MNQYNIRQPYEFLDEEELREYALRRMKDASLTYRILNKYKKASMKHIEKHLGEDYTMIPERQNNYDGCWDGE